MKENQEKPEVQTIIVRRVERVTDMAAPSANANTDTHIITAKELPKKVSFDYNCRAPSKASRAYKKMREVLRQTPDKFAQLNGGITLANDTFVLDGGHTFLAIQDAIKEDEIDPAVIKVRVVNLGKLSHEEMVRRSVALNTRVTPPLRGERDLEGTWNQMRKSLSKDYEKFYEFRPNTRPNAPFKVDMLVALLHAWTVDDAERCYSGKGLLVRLYSDEKYGPVLPHLNTAIDFYSKLYRTLLKEPAIQKLPEVKLDSQGTLPTGEHVKGVIPEAFIWPMFSVFSAMLSEDKEDWDDNPVRFLGEKKDPLIKQMLEDYRRCGKNASKYGKDKNSYLNMRITFLTHFGRRHSTKKKESGVSARG